MILLAVVTFLQCGLIAGVIPWRRLAWVSGGSLAYSLASWWVLRRWFARVTAVNLGTVFLAVDLLWFAGMIWVSGADRSRLVLVLLVRVADQTNTSLAGAGDLPCAPPLVAVGPGPSVSAPPHKEGERSDRHD
jgi:hypothetical protein